AIRAKGADVVGRKPAFPAHDFEPALLETIEPVVERPRPDGSINLLRQAGHVGEGQAVGLAVNVPDAALTAQYPAVANAGPQPAFLIFQQAIGNDFFVTWRTGTGLEPMVPKRHQGF